MHGCLSLSRQTQRNLVWIHCSEHTGFQSNERIDWLASNSAYNEWFSNGKLFNGANDQRERDFCVYISKESTMQEPKIQTATTCNQAYVRIVFT